MGNTFRLLRDTQSAAGRERERSAVVTPARDDGSAVTEYVQLVSIQVPEVGSVKAVTALGAQATARPEREAPDDVRARHLMPTGLTCATAGAR